MPDFFLYKYLNQLAEFDQVSLEESASNFVVMVTSGLIALDFIFALTRGSVQGHVLYEGKVL